LAIHRRSALGMPDSAEHAAQAQAERDATARRLPALEARCAGLQADALRAAALDRRCAELQAQLSAAQQVLDTIAVRVTSSLG
jgi:hypothetical protein